MYQVTIHYQDSPNPVGTMVKTTSELHEFLCNLQVLHVVHLEINYVRRIDSPDFIYPTAV